jgi:hypothetical protein
LLQKYHTKSTFLLSTKAKRDNLHLFHIILFLFFKTTKLKILKSYQKAFLCSSVKQLRASKLSLKSMFHCIFRIFVTFLFLLYIKHKYLILSKKNYLFPKLWDFFTLFFIYPFIQFIAKISRSASYDCTS